MVNGDDSVRLDTSSSVWRGQGPGYQCFKVDETLRTRKHTFLLVTRYTALLIRPRSQRRIAHTDSMRHVLIY